MATSGQSRVLACGAGSMNCLGMHFQHRLTCGDITFTRYASRRRIREPLSLQVRGQMVRTELSAPTARPARQVH